VAALDAEPRRSALLLAIAGLRSRTLIAAASARRSSSGTIAAES
jgi:hypothetical protein